MAWDMAAAKLDEVPVEAALLAGLEFQPNFVVASYLARGDRIARSR